MKSRIFTAVAAFAANLFGRQAAAAQPNAAPAPRPLSDYAKAIGQKLKNIGAPSATVSSGRWIRSNGGTLLKARGHAAVRRAARKAKGVARNRKAHR